MSAKRIPGPPDSTEIPITAARSAMIAAINREYALVMLSNHPVILHEFIGPDGEPDFAIRNVGGWHEWMRPRKIQKEGEKPLPASRVWIASEERRQYEGIVFDPSGQAPRSYYNMWRGFSVEPAEPGTPSGCARFLDHLYENVCSGNDHLYGWVVAWFARMVQRPSEKSGTSLVLRGGQGTGKTIVGRTIGSLLTPHYELVADTTRVGAKFNSYLKRCLLLQLDEATWGGDHAAAGRLKDLITGDWQYIEYKGFEPLRVRNYVRLLLTGNNAWLVPAGMDERRFAVIDVAEHRRQDRSYFRAINDEMDSGGRESLLRYLLDYELPTVPGDIPRTTALAEQQLNSLPDEEAWWLEVLKRGVLPGDKFGDSSAPCQTMHHAYIEHMVRLGRQRRMTNSQLGQSLSRLVPGLAKAHPRRHRVTGASERVWEYVFPSLTECRTAFGRLVGGELFTADGGADAGESERWEADPSP